MPDRILRSLYILLSVVVVGGVAWLASEQVGRPRARATAEDAGAVTTAAPDAGSQAPTSAAGSASAASNGAGVGDAGAAGAGGAAAILDTGDGGLSLFGLTIDGGSMPSGAPRAVRLGVILVQWAGAEGASSAARAKPDALKRAQELAEQAKTDFKAAVKAGDSGSAEDIGRMPRGVLDARTEVAVFSLAAGDISEPLETPRGYWVVKRID